MKQKDYEKFLKEKEEFISANKEAELKSNQEKQNFQMKLDEAKRQNIKLQNQIIDLTNNTSPNKLNYDTIVKLRVKNNKLIVVCCVLSVMLFCSLLYIVI